MFANNIERHSSETLVKIRNKLKSQQIKKQQKYFGVASGRAI